MPSLKVIIDGSSAPFERELKRTDVLVSQAARNMSTSMARETKVGLGGIVRESVVIAREIAQGRGGGRIAASFTLLYQYLRNLATETKAAAGPARILAEGYEKLALSSAKAAQASLRQAQASEAAFFDEGAENLATAQAADADRAKAQADLQVAASARAKASSAAVAAEAEEAEAAATAAAGESSFLAVTGAGILAASLAAVALAAALAYEKFKGFKDVLEEADFKPADLEENYIPLLKRHISDTRNDQKAVTDEVNKTAQAYNSAAQQAKRVSEETKEHYGHLQKMLTLQKETALAKATSPAAKFKVEQEFAGRELQLRKDQHQEEILNKQREVKSLKVESQSQLDLAGRIKVKTKEEDSQILEDLKKNADAGQAFLKGGGRWQEFKREAAADLGGSAFDINKRKARIAAVEAGGAEAANKAIAEFQNFSNKVTANDELRKKRAELVKGAGESASLAAKGDLEIKDMARNFDRQNQDAKAESDAQLALERAELRRNKGGSFGPGLTQFERAGGFMAGVTVADVAVDQLKELKQIREGVHKLNKRGGVKF